MTSTETLRAAEEHRVSGRLQEARQLCNSVLRAAPDDANALHLLGVIALQEGDARAAVPLVERAIKARRNNAQFHRTMGMALLALGELDAAISHLRRALRLKPDDYFSHSALGRTLHAAGRLPESTASLKRALALNEGDPDAHFYLGITLLTEGDFERGWVEYEYRTARRELQRRGLFEHFREWRGEDVAGKTLLLHREQGYGDTFQFARYAPLLAARGAKVVLAAPREMVSVLATMPALEVIAEDNLPAADFCSILGSLPLAFGTRLDSIPASVPYLAAPAAHAERWRGRIAGGGLRVGLVWAGSPTHSNDRNRSMALAAVAGLAEIPGVTLYSLQKGPATAAITPGMKLVALGEEFADFADTAAVLEQLDLLVSVDTSVVHLAGALGRPVLLMLPTGPDWRWLLEREDTPWYPTVRLVRQRSPGDWAGVIERVAEDLKRRVAAGPRR